MRIGMMLRAYDELGGVGVYTRNIVAELLAADRDNHYVLFYKNQRWVGTFAHYENVSERVVAPGWPKPLWDQWAIPRACRHERVDVLFHPKFTAPFLAPCPVVMVVHGADWFMPDQHVYYPWLDVRYIRAVMPWYFKKCAVVVSVSELTTENFYQVLDLPPGKCRTVYFGPAKHFRKIDDPATLEAARRKYDLPERYVLTLTKLTGDKRKNLPNLLAGYKHYHESTDEPVKLVVGGKDCHLLLDRHGLAGEPWTKDLVFPGWMDQADLPAVFSGAELYLYPSNLEAFPIPITESLACGKAIVTSNVNGLVELAGDAALQVDPKDPPAIGEAIGRVLRDDALRQDLEARALERSKRFSWEKCARETLAILEEVAVGRKA